MIEYNAMNNSRHMMLTGAGFTHNLGTPLSKGMWAQIYSHPLVQGSPKLKMLMSKNFDFEEVYHIVNNGRQYSENDRSAIKETVLAAYSDLDEIIRLHGQGGVHPLINVGKFQAFIEHMMGNENSGYLFTLNQDLFIERTYGSAAILPGIAQPSLSLMADQPLVNENYVDMPTVEDLGYAKSEFDEISGLKYVKLHGSQNWRGERGLVIGLDKTSLIENEPVLYWYSKIFESVIKKGGHMLCIGYGFGDDHINKTLKEGLDFGMALHIVSPQDPENFRDGLILKSCGSELWDAVASYHQCSLNALFPWYASVNTGAPPQELVRLYRSFLG